MKYQNPRELAATATAYPLEQPEKMSVRQRIERWADLLERHGGAISALRQIEYLSPEARREYSGANTPLTVAYNDPVLRQEGLKGDRLGDAMEFFNLTDSDAHVLLCDCHYHGTMTGNSLAYRLRRHARTRARRAAVRQAIGRFFGFGS